MSDKNKLNKSQKTPASPPSPRLVKATPKGLAFKSKLLLLKTEATNMKTVDNSMAKASLTGGLKSVEKIDKSNKVEKKKSKSTSKKNKNKKKEKNNTSKTSLKSKVGSSLTNSKSSLQGKSTSKTKLSKPASNTNLVKAGSQTKLSKTKSTTTNKSKLLKVKSSVNNKTTATMTSGNKRIKSNLSNNSKLPKTQSSSKLGHKKSKIKIKRLKTSSKLTINSKSSIKKTSATKVGSAQSKVSVAQKLPPITAKLVKSAAGKVSVDMISKAKVQSDQNLTKEAKRTNSEPKNAETPKSETKNVEQKKSEENNQKGEKQNIKSPSSGGKSSPEANTKPSAIPVITNPQAAVATPLNSFEVGKSQIPLPKSITEVQTPKSQESIPVQAPDPSKAISPKTTIFDEEKLSIPPAIKKSNDLTYALSPIQAESAFLSAEETLNSLKNVIIPKVEQPKEEEKEKTKSKSVPKIVEQVIPKKGEEFSEPDTTPMFTPKDNSPPSTSPPSSIRRFSQITNASTETTSSVADSLGSWFNNPRALFWISLGLCTSFGIIMVAVKLSRGNADLSDVAIDMAEGAAD